MFASRALLITNPLKVKVNKGLGWIVSLKVSVWSEFKSRSGVQRCYPEVSFSCLVFFNLIDLPPPPFFRSLFLSTCWILSLTETQAHALRTGHVTFLLCLFLPVSSIHAPHHLPIPLTISCSYPSGRSEWTSLAFAGPADCGVGWGWGWGVGLGCVRRPVGGGVGGWCQTFGRRSPFLCHLFALVADVPRNFSVNLATKTSVLLTWEFPEGSNPYRFTVGAAAA